MTADETTIIPFEQYEQKRLLDIEAAAHLLEQAETIQEVAYIRDYAEAVRLVARQAKAGLEAQNRAADLKLRAERKAGGMLASIERAPGQKTSLTGSTRLQEALDATGVDKKIAYRWQDISTIPEPVFEQHLIETKAADRELTSVGAVRLAKSLNGHTPHVSHNSGENEWYTPAHIIEAARAAMGSIDLDPASSDTANQIVLAPAYYTMQDNGLECDWYGNVWLNPPYSQPEIARFCERVSDQYMTGAIQQACVLVNNATETAWFQTLLEMAAAVCFLRGRVRYLDKTLTPAKTPLQGQAVVYYGPAVETFREHFSEHGTVLYGRK